LTSIEFPTRGNTAVGIDVDTNGYPWFGTCNNGGGSYNFPYVVKNNATDGTSDFRYVTVRKLSTTYAAFPTWRVTPVCLSAGKVLVFYVDSSPYSQYWNGTAWGSEVSVGADMASNVYYSLVVYGDTVHLVYLEYDTYDIEHRKWTADSWSAVATIQSATTSTSAPVLSVTSTGELYVFWAGSPTANHIYRKKYAAGAWDSSPTDWINESTEQLTSNDLITCFYKQYGNYIGLLYMTKTTSPYNVKFAYLTVAVVVKKPIVVGDGLTFAVIFVELPPTDPWEGWFMDEV
jgi:hypothetical protein